MSEQAAGTQVLIVDDDAIMGELLDALLTIEGYRVTRAVSGEEALEVVRAAEFKPDVILFDIHMPGMHGGELAAALLQARASGMLLGSTVFIAMSGSTPRAQDSTGFDEFLRKPFTVADFANAVESARDRVARPAEAADSWTQDEGSRRCSPLDEKILGQLRSKIGPEPLRQLYDMTLEDVRARVERMRAAAERGDAAAIKHEAHTIKGSCGMVGALELQALAAATEGGSAVDTSALADFNSACQRLERMLNEKL